MRGAGQVSTAPSKLSIQTEFTTGQWMSTFPQWPSAAGNPKARIPSGHYRCQNGHAGPGHIPWQLHGLAEQRMCSEAFSRSIGRPQGQLRTTASFCGLSIYHTT